MAQQPPPVPIDLSRLPISDGTGQVPTNANHGLLPAGPLLDLLTGYFNADAALVQQWGTEIQFFGALPQGFSQWSYHTSGQGREVKNIYGHPRTTQIRTATKFFDHVVEIMDANELSIRNSIHFAQPNNQINLARFQTAILLNRPVVCNSTHL